MTDEADKKEELEAQAESIESEDSPVAAGEAVPAEEQQAACVSEPDLPKPTQAPEAPLGETPEVEPAEDSEQIEAQAGDEAEGEDEEEPPILPELDPERANLPWYVVHAYSGYEMRAKLSLEERIRSAGLQNKFGNIVVPEERVVELVRGSKKTSKRKFFPGYILVQCELDDETWHLVKDTPKITGFVGDSRNPVPLSEAEVSSLLQQMEGGAQRPRPSVQFEQGDSIKVVDGPFADFNGTVDEVKADKGKLRVLISIFGRNTPVELDFVQVEKV